MQACGSGGTTAGVALGNHLSGMGARVWAYGVCDDPEYFYAFIQGLLDGLGATLQAVGNAYFLALWTGHIPDQNSLLFQCSANEL